MRGTIGVQSEVGSGSTFTMTIPLRHITTRADSEASSNVDVPLSRHSSVHAEETKNLKAPPADRSTANSAHSESNTGPVTFESDAQPRLVGLSQPFFASPQPLESPGSQQAAVDRIAAEASKRAEKVTVLGKSSR